MSNGATDCLSEGVNLQEHFDPAIHCDLSWNPTRLTTLEDVTPEDIALCEAAHQVFGPDLSKLGNYFRNSTEHVLFGVRGHLRTRVDNIPAHCESSRSMTLSGPRRIRPMGSVSASGATGFCQPVRSRGASGVTWPLPSVGEPRRTNASYAALSLRKINLARLLSLTESH
jgi:hypothetical protein